MAALLITNLLARLRMDILVPEALRRPYLSGPPYRENNIWIFLKFSLKKIANKHKTDKTPQTLQLIAICFQTVAVITGYLSAEAQSLSVVTANTG